MGTPLLTSTLHPARPHRPGKLRRDTVFMVGDLLPLLDFVGIALAAWLATFAVSFWFSADAQMAGLDLWENGGRLALVAVVLAPLVLCDRNYVYFASSGHTAALIRCFSARFLMLSFVVAAIGFASRTVQNLPGAWLGLWLASALLFTALTRAMLVLSLRRLERMGMLTETVAVIGAGAEADRFIRHLRRMRGASVEILQVFDDRLRVDKNCKHAPAGSITDLIELGKSCSLDWIVLALPGCNNDRLNYMVHRLKALAVPVALCPKACGLIVRRHDVRNLGDGLLVTLLADRPRKNWRSITVAAEAVLPRWVVTWASLLLRLPLHAAIFLINTLRKLRTPGTAITAPQNERLVCTLDPYDASRFTEVAARFGQTRFGYVVTPNADHLIRLHREPAFRELYDEAAYVLLDSRFLSHLLRITRNMRLPVCTGSDLTARLFNYVIMPDDRLVLIGGGPHQAARICERYGLKQLAHFNPPMGFIDDPAALEACLQFIERHSPFRYCMLAVGAPQQEIVARSLKTRGAARGLALCIGGSINFLTGEERRAPHWIQSAGFEWLFRLTQAPARMAGRYLVRGPQVFRLLRHTEIVLRAAPNTPMGAMPANVPVITTARPAIASLFKNPFAASRSTSARRAMARRDAAP